MTGYSDIEDVVFDGDNAVEAGVAVDDFPDELAFAFGGGGVFAGERRGEAGAGFLLMGLKEHVVAGESKAKCIHGGSLFAGFGFWPGGVSGVLAVDFGESGGGHFVFSRLECSRDFLRCRLVGLDVIENGRKKYFLGS